MTDQTVEYEDKAEETSSPDGRVRVWLDAIDAAAEEEKEWRLQADRAVRIYRAEDSEKKNNHFNILHSNVETILPAIYNSTPVPDIRRRFNDPGQPAKDVSDILQRCISRSLDAYDFDGMMRSVLFDGFVAGRGVSRVRYVPYLQPGTDPSIEEDAGEGQAGAEMSEPAALEGLEQPEPGEVVAFEEVVTEYVPWKHFRRGPGFVWDDVTWIAFEHFLTREQLRSLAEEKADKVSLDCSVEKEREDDRSGVPNSEVYARARVWEIWDKETKKVLFVAPSYMDEPLREEDDPLGLQGFYPVPRPLVPLPTPGHLVPVCPYRAYEDLAEELNEVTRRIQKITKQLRVRGVYASSAQDMEAIVTADDGELVAAQGLEAFVSSGGLDKAIAWWPIEPAVKALAQLYTQRDQVKQSIYEITGISDIVRGASSASETATAQQIKSQWGSLRIQRMQAEVARYARDLFRMKAEIISARFSPQTIGMMTGVQLQPEAEALLRSDVLRGYKIDIESDSTIRSDLTRNQQTMTEFVMGTAGYIQAVGPAVQAGILPANLAVEIYTAFARNFRLGKQVEDALDQAGEASRQQAQQPQEPKPDPAMVEAQQKQQLAQADLQARTQIEAAKLQLEQQKMQQQYELEVAKMQQEFELKRAGFEADINMKREQHAMSSQFAQEKHATDIEMKRQGKNPDAKVSINHKAEDIMAPISDAMAQLGQLIVQQSMDAQARQDQQMAALSQIAALVAAPKKVIRGRNGQVEGVAPDMNGMIQ